MFAVVGSIDITLGNEWSKVLSPRECQVAILVARGLSNKEVARELGVTDGTVKGHVHVIFRKLGARNRYNVILQSRAAASAE
jgi:two-component system, NarL family, nitrate/nitrite response regulator NarL